MDGHELADAAGGSGPGVGRGLHGRHVASAASIIATNPFVSTIPSASPIRRLHPSAQQLHGVVHECLKLGVC